MKNNKTKSMFPLNEVSNKYDANTRYRETYKVVKCKTKWFQNSAIPYMQTLLNAHHCKKNFGPNIVSILLGKNFHFQNCSQRWYITWALRAARGRNLADCGRICGSPLQICRLNLGKVEEMFQMINNAESHS